MNRKVLLIMTLFLLLLNVNIIFADTKTYERQYNPYQFLPDTLYYCGFNSCNYVRDLSGWNRRIYQRYDFSDINETIKHAYVSVQKTNTFGVSLDVQGRYYEDGIWSSMTWNNQGSMVSGGSTLLFSKQPTTFPLNVYENQTYDIAPLINSDPDKIFTIQYKWENELNSGSAFDFLMNAKIEYEILDPNCTRDWDCINWSTCQESEVKECNQAYDINDCGFAYDGDYSEFGYPSCCYEDWEPQYDSICELNNTQIKYYTDENTCGSTDYLPFDNGTEVACDYCQPDLEFIEEQCQWNGTSYFTYTYYEDDNYFSCCAMTGEEDDCIFNTAPYNETNQTFCVDMVEEFTLEIDENVFLNAYVEDKVYGTVWLNNTNETFTCQSYIKTLDGYGINDKKTIQINPVYAQKEQSLISFSSNTVEDREYFTTNKGMATIYYTKENIIFDGRPYLLGVECTGNETKQLLRTEKVAYVSYAHFNEPITRFVWLRDNALYLFMGLVIVIVAVTLIAIFIRNAKGR